ncbi:SPFH domain / Band 7 family protein [Babesia caballi]|uniref:SPFH domain / Band 7 family protein n=1 Tax=Babesia caballi TaxID=5871 RepID=A0AAV4LW16_BABCB|nr:SPFH domain / Band 7 family protein [Babesia caballi]
MNSAFLLRSAMCAVMCFLSISAAIPETETRERFSDDDAFLRIDRLREEADAAEARLNNVAASLEAAGKHECSDLKCVGVNMQSTDSVDSGVNNVLNRIEDLIGKENGKIVRYVATIAEHIQKNTVGSGELPKEQTTQYLLEEILAALEAQGEGFDYGSIGDRSLWSRNIYSSAFHGVPTRSPTDSTGRVSPWSLDKRQLTTVNYVRPKSPSRAHMGLVIVPQQTVYVIERFGKFSRTIGAGMHLLWPMIDSISYIHSLKEDAIVLPNQTAITKDNVILQIDGVLYVKCVDPYHASYGIEDPIFAMTQMAQTTMRSELGKLSLDTTFLERDNLNQKIVEAINAAASNWGMVCMRYEIRDITLPSTIVSAMERQVEAERSKRASILRSEGDKEAEINMAISQREISILKAEGEAIAERERADATAYALQKITNTLKETGTVDAVSLRLAEKYIAAFANLAKESNTVVLPANVGGVGDIVTQAVTLFKSLNKKCATSDLTTDAAALVKLHHPPKEEATTST